MPGMDCIGFLRDDWGAHIGRFSTRSGGTTRPSLGCSGPGSGARRGTSWTRLSAWPLRQVPLRGQHSTVDPRGWLDLLIQTDCMVLDLACCARPRAASPELPPSLLGAPQLPRGDPQRLGGAGASLPGPRRCCQQPGYRWAGGGAVVVPSPWMSVLAAGHRVTVDKRSLRSACGVLVETRIMVRGAPVRRLRLKQSSRSATAWPWNASTAARWLEPPSAALRLARTAASLLLVVCLRHMPAAPARRLSFWR